MEILLIISALFLAYSNGANDNFKGVSTLFGSGTSNFIISIGWGTISTLLGSIFAIYLAHGLMQNFSGKGLIPDESLKDPAIATAVALGAAVTVFFATKIGLPISTTHAIVGALVGAGFMAVGNALNLSQLTYTFLLPLLVSPFIACFASIFLYLLFRRLRLFLKIDKDTHFIANPPIKNVNQFMAPGVSVQQIEVEKYTGDIVGISAQKLLDAFHFISAGAVGFARGMNDAPKIAGLLLLIHFFSVPLIIVLVAVAMAIGGLLHAKKVAITMSKKITSMNAGQGFTSNLVTAVLVWTASISGMPVSTTHVSVGGIFGIGISNKKVDYKMVGKIIGSWVIT
ncbi:MAG: inorganic phosphate transporter, partial [Chitinophagales bacterium]|nr:inorganic phosphate transporter [Chitinophagales bacterium]